MESADAAAKRQAHAAAERKIRKKRAKRELEGARSFTQTQKEKVGERLKIASDTKSFHADKNANKVIHTKGGGSLSNLHRPFYTATKSAVKGTVKGAVKLAKKVMQRDSD